MEIRPSTPADIPAIVALLKMSLGESLMPKSEGYWRWKHVDNPFGQSPVLLATEGGEIVGVRAFMRWAWQNGPTRLEAVRAVDTATHPAFQGKGIFSKLTTAMLDYCKSEGMHLVFNTPNEKSLPGYLKMGWVTAGKLPVGLKVLNPVSMAKHVVTRAGTEREGHLHQDTAILLNHPALPRLLEAHMANQSNKYVAAYTAKALQWRYLDVPVAKYHATGLFNDTEINAMFIYRLKGSRLGTELRVTDVFLKSPEYATALRKLLYKTARLAGADYLTQGGLQPVQLTKGLLRFRASIGPVVTVRSINLPGLEDFLNFNRWSPALGDLELF